MSANVTETFALASVVAFPSIATILIHAGVDGGREGFDVVGAAGEAGRSGRRVRQTEFRGRSAHAAASSRSGPATP